MPYNVFPVDNSVASDFQKAVNGPAQVEPVTEYPLAATTDDCSFGWPDIGRKLFMFWMFNYLNNQL